MEKEYFRMVLTTDRPPVETDTYITNQDTYTRWDGDSKKWRLDEDQKVEWWLEPCQISDELPDRDEVSNFADKHSNNFPDMGASSMCNAAQYEGAIEGAEWIKQIASVIIAKNRETIQHWKDAVSEERIIKKKMMKELSKANDRIKKVEAALLKAKKIKYKN